MKQLKLPLLLSIVALFTSCKDNAAEPADLSGAWSSEEIHINGKLQGEQISKTTHLNLNNDKSFYKNYIEGMWSYEKGKLHLTPNEDLSIQPLQYEVVSVYNATLTLNITMTESEYGWDFEGIEADELITVTEKYRKQ